MITTQYKSNSDLHLSQLFEALFKVYMIFHLKIKSTHKLKESEHSQKDTFSWEMKRMTSYKKETYLF